MNQTVDILDDFDADKDHAFLFKITSAGYFISILCAGIFLFWTFKESLSNLFQDEEFVMLASIQVLFPLIACTLFLFKRKLGWFLLQFFSLANVIYSIGFFITEHYVDETDFFSLGQFLLAFLMLKQGVLKTVSLERKTANIFTLIIVFILVIFFSFFC